jgi:glycosyltransferase involved in cell wall biosynthesis
MSRIAIPDLYVTWVPGAVYRGKQLVREHNFDVVFTTIPPNSTALIGYLLKRLTSAKWVMDYRDPWCPNPFNQLGRIRYSLEKKIEDSMLTRSDLNVSTSELITNIYRENYPKIADRFCTITNCYDPELQFVSSSGNIESRSMHKFRIVHAGSFYPKRNPTSFLKGLIALLDAYPDLRGKIEVIFVGIVTEKYRTEISELIGSSSVDFQMVGAVSYKESMHYICSSDLLLAINGTEDQDNIFVPGKLFDYIAANKPILFMGHRGAASEIIEKGNIGAVCEHDDIDGISREILSFYRRRELFQLFEPNTPYIRRYHASNVAKQLAELLDSVVRSRVDVN